LLKEMKAELAGKVTFYKFDCSKKNKALGVTLGIKVAPTFLLYKNNELVETIKGAKVDALEEAIAKFT
jgi:thioredoxin 1